MAITTDAGDEIAAADDQKPAIAAKADQNWDLDHEEKARQIADDDLNRKNKQVSSCFPQPLTRLAP